MKNLFVDPTPVSMDDTAKATLVSSEMNSPSHVGGGIITVVIVTCGGRLGAATVVTVGTAITSVAA